MTTAEPESQECKHGLTMDWCADCNGKAKEQAAELIALRNKMLKNGWLAAQYGGRCHRCGTGYGIGTLIKWTSSPSGGWMAECCATEEGEPHVFT